MKRINYIVAILCGLVLMSSRCYKDGDCRPGNVNGSKIYLDIKDKTTGRFLYSENNSLYPLDSLQIADLSGNPLTFFDYLRSNRYDENNLGIQLKIYNSQTDANSFSTELCKDIVLKYKYNETDTIKACFKSETTECGSQFDKLAIYHKGKLLNTIYDKQDISITLIKGQ